MSAKPGRLALRETFTLRLTATVCLIAISQFNFGFEQQGFSAVQAMKAFDRQFGTYNSSQQAWVLEPAWLSLFNSLNYIGFAAGLIIGSWTSKHYGRRMCMFSMSLSAIVSAIIIITSKNRGQLMAGRILNYVYIGMELSVVPIYQSEIVPASARGFVVATYQVSLVIGSLIMNCICRGTSTINGRASWQIPLGLFFVIPTIVACAIWFVPESPRWLATQDRHEEGLAALRLFREGRFTDDETETEYAIVRSSVSHTEKGGFFEQFNKANRRRTFIVLVVNFFIQATGNIFATIYGAVYINSLKAVNPFNITICVSITNLVFGVLAMFMIEKIGRRRLLMIGGMIQLVALMTMGALGTITPATYGIKIGIVVTLIVFSAGFSSGWAPIVHSLSAELPTQALRDMSYRTGSAVNIVMQFVVAFSLPYLLYSPYANLNSKVGFIFGSFAALSIVFAFFFVPEVRGRTLEEIDKLFASGIPIRQFKHATLTVETELADTGIKKKVIHVDDPKAHNV